LGSHLFSRNIFDFHMLKGYFLNITNVLQMVLGIN